MTAPGASDRLALRAGVLVALASALAVLGPPLGLSPGLIALAVGLVLAGLSLDAARFSGMGGHVLAEALPGGRARLRRIAVHEAGHVLQAEREAMPVRQVLVGSLACARAGLSSRGSTAFDLPAHAKLPLEELRRWSRVLQAGMVAEELLYGAAEGGADDRALLGRLWGLSGYDVTTAQREQRQARRGVLRDLRERLPLLEQRAEDLLAPAPRLFRAPPSSDGGSGEP
jgi:hypothetical protein